MGKQTCANCRFFVREKQRQSAYNYCRRYPPTDYESPADKGTKIYDENSWCGEWKKPNGHGGDK